MQKALSMADSMRGLLMVAAFEVILGGITLASAALQDDAMRPELLALDDECSSNPASLADCALSEVQLRAGKVAKDSTGLQASSSAGSRWWPFNWWPFGSGGGYSGPGLSHPKYCESLPAGMSNPFCEGSNTCQCQSYCNTQPDDSKGWDPNCCGCGSLVQRDTSTHTAGKKVVMGAKETGIITRATDGQSAGFWPFSSGSGTTGPNLQHPKYCDTLPPGTDNPYCVGGTTCQCQSYCTTQTDDAKGYDPNCCACGSLVQQGSSTEEGTGKAAAAKANHADASRVLGAQGARMWPFSSGTGTTGPNLQHPKYCDGVPPESNNPYCVGGTTCQCQSYCTTQTDDAKGYDPNCCACGGFLQQGSTEAAAGDVADRKATRTGLLQSRQRLWWPSWWPFSQ